MLITTGNHLRSQELYNGLGLPENNNPQWLNSGALHSSGFPTSLDVTSVAGGVKIDSNGNDAEYSGYSNYNPLTSSFVNPDFPTLDQKNGYSIFFNLSLDTANDFFDQNNNRAAFSITVIGAEKKGIEIGFDSDQIFAQNENFTQGEIQSWATNVSRDYQLTVSENSYKLLANTDEGLSTIINGSLRNYNFDPLNSSPSLNFNPYEIPNFLFFGDNTGEAHGTFTLGKIAVETASEEVVAVPFDGSASLGLILIAIAMITKSGRVKQRNCS